MLLLSMRLNLKNTKYLKEVTALISKHPEKNYTTKELAELAGVSIPKFNMDFRQLHKQSLHRYMLRIKIEHAIKLIEKKKLPIYKIALLTGFKSTPELIKAFKKHFRQKAPKP